MAEHIAYDTDKRIIYVTTAPVDGVVSIDIKEHLYSDMKVDWQSDAALNKFELPIRSTGGDALPGSKSLGATFFLNSRWKIRPYEQDHIFRMNGNLFSEDGTSVMIPTLGGYQVLAEMFVSNLTDSTVQQLAEIEQASFEGGVTIDQNNIHTGSAVAGTDFPTGTPRQPSDNLADTYTLGESRGLGTIYVQGNLIISDEAPMDDYSFIGESTTKTVITINPEASVIGAEFYYAHITGTLDGDSVIRECVVDNLTYIEGSIVQTMLNPGVIELSTDSNGVAHFIQCFSGVPGTGTPSINMGGDGAALAMRDYNGGVKLVNKSGTNSVSIDLNSGQVILASTVTNGEIVVRGMGKLIDEAGDPIPTGIWNGATIINETNSYLAEGSSGGLTPEQDEILDNINAQVIELYKLQGLSAGHPMTVTATQRVVDTITLAITGDGETISTVTRQ